MSPAVLAEPVDFNLPAQPADGALMAFCKQAKAELIFSYDKLHVATSGAVIGRYEPDEALRLLLSGTGFEAKRNASGRFVVSAVAQEGVIRGRLVTPEGGGARGVRVAIEDERRSTVTDDSGAFEFTAVPTGTYRLAAGAPGYQTLEIAGVQVVAGRVLRLDPQVIKVASDPGKLEPYVVQGQAAPSGPLADEEATQVPRTAIGNVDQPRSENDALDYTVFTRDQITRSGVVDVNEFLERQILDSDAATLPPERNGSAGAYASGSTNLSLRGYGADETIILVNGRRLPEVVTALPADLAQGPQAPQADVNVIPLNLIERIEVLPVSASAIYSGSPVGGVINIVLRPDFNTAELTTTYTNAVAGFNAPESTVSLMSGQTLLAGKLHVRLSATYTQVDPPTESDLGFIRSNLQAHPQPESILYRATPNVSSANGSPLFGPGTPSYTSVAPGADGSGGLGPFTGREGTQSLALFQPLGGGLANSPDSMDYAYGRKVRSGSFYGSATYDLLPGLQVGFDVSAGRTVNTTGTTVFNGALSLPASSPFNPFGQTVGVTLNDTLPGLGASYDEALVDHYSGVFGVLLQMRDDWQASMDAQYGLSVTRYRGIANVDNTAWQQLVDQGIYNPLRDTQAFGPPRQFYDHAVEFYGGEGQFVTLGDYDTFDSSLRISNATLQLPTGTSTVVVGGDYRYARLANYVYALSYGYGSLVAPANTWVGRSLQRVSTFTEIQTPLIPSRWLPSWIHGVSTDLAVRYTASTLANEANFAPTGAVKVEFGGGFSLRGSYATSNTFPPPYFSRLQDASIATSGSGPTEELFVYDPRRGNQQQQVTASDAVNPNLVPEAAVTQTAGVLFDRGTVHHLRASLDFVNTVTSGEQKYLYPQQVVDLEAIFPTRVIRAAPIPGDPYVIGPITSVLTGNYNLAWRHSYEWSASVDYSWTQCLGGSLDLYCRLIDFQRYDLEVLPTLPPVDELRAPDGTTPGLLKTRVNFGAGWSNKTLGFGIDGQYFSSRILPADEWAAQGSDHVNPYTEFGAYLQGNLSRFIPWRSPHYGLSGQLRIDNFLGAKPAKYAEDASGSGVESYTDWRGRVYSVTLTVTF